MTSRETEKDDVAAAGVSSTDQNENVDKHPWPYLSSLFSFCSAAANTYRFKCLLCTPKVTECSAYRNSPSNLKKHIERMHPARLEDYGKLAAGARKRMAGGSEDSPSKKKLKQPSIGALLSNANMVTQAAVDDAIANFVIGTLQPLRVVEHPDFIALIATLQPNRKVMCRRTLRKRIAEAAKEMKQKLVKTLGDQATVATTTDCWSAYGKSYIGVTVHWIDVGTLDRKSACLALRRLKGSHTYDVIAAALNDIHAEYGIRKKVTRTTTDNGANFVKAFSVFAQMSRGQH